MVQFQLPKRFLCLVRDHPSSFFQQSLDPPLRRKWPNFDQAAVLDQARDEFREFGGGGGQAPIRACLRSRLRRTPCRALIETGRNSIKMLKTQLCEKGTSTVG
jgi:hypothetical protein